MLNLDAIDRTTMQSVPYSFDEKPESVFQDIAPLGQFSAVIVRSDNSWHMVTPVASTALQCRLALRIAFFHNLDPGV